MFGERFLSANPSSSRTIQQRIFLLLKNCDSIRNLAQIYTQIVTGGFSGRSFILVKLLGLYLSHGKLVLARVIFEQIKTPSTTVWNQIIRGYAHSNDPRESIRLFGRMLSTEQDPDGFTYSFLLSACVQSKFLEEGTQLHAKIVENGLSANLFVQTNLINLYAKNGWENGILCASRLFDEMPLRNLVAWNSMLDAYLRSGRIDRARKVFDEMPEKNVVSWTIMISWYAKNGMCKQALSMFREFGRCGVCMDQVVLIAALSACAELGHLELGRSIHSYVLWAYESKNQPLLISLQNSLIHMYASCGMMKDAYNIFVKMPKRSSVSWTSMITGFAKQSMPDKALSMFARMRTTEEGDIKPDAITFIAVLSACSHAGLVEEGQHFFEQMTRYWGVEPQIKHYGCMVDILSRAGLVDEAYRLICSMPMNPNNAIWGSILGGCRTYKNVDLASDVTGNLMMELNPERAAGYLMILENIFAMGARWHDVISVHHKLNQLGFKKPAGRSWIQISGTVHHFVAGDITHKDTSSMYEMIMRITWHSSFKSDANASEIVLLSMAD